jgi:hypothetical protein
MIPTQLNNNYLKTMKENNNILNRYIEFCANSKIHQTSKFTVDPWGEIDRPRIMAMDTFQYVYTGIGRIRRFIKSLGLTLDYATIPVDRPEWEDGFSLYDDVKYSNDLLKSSPITEKNCRFYINEEEVALVSGFSDECVMMIDLTRLSKVLSEKND